MARPPVSQIDEIRQQMAQLRLGLHQDATTVVDETALAFDWKTQLTKRPWLTFGAAVVVGFLVVPRRRRPEPAAVPVPARQVEAIVAAVEDRRRPEKKSGSGGAFWGLAKLAFSIGGPIALQAAQSYAIAWLEDSLTRQQQGRAGQPLGPTMPPAPGRGASTSTTRRP